MDLNSIGRLIAQRRRARGLTLLELATRAGVGRSTLAALEAGKLAELGLGKVARLCTEVDLSLEARPPPLEAPLMDHRHLTEAAGRQLTKAAIEDVLVRGELPAWQGLIRAVRADRTGHLARRVREVATAAGKQDSKARAFATLLTQLQKPGVRRG